MFRTVLAASLSVAVLSISASAALFTTQLDELQSAVEARQAALPAKLNKSEKLAAKSYKTVQKKLSKDSVSLKGDLKIAKAVVKLEKLKDDALNGLLDSATFGLAGEVQVRVEGLQLRYDLSVTASKSKATPEKALKALIQAQDRIDFANGELKRKKRIAWLLKADAAATKAEALMDKLGFTGGGDGGGGGGGGGLCGGTPIGVGDAAGGVIGMGEQWTGNEYIIDTSGPQTVVTIFECTGGDEPAGRQFVFVLPAPLVQGEFDVRATGSSLTVSNLGELGVQSLDGSITIARADTRIQISYVFTGATRYQGGFSLPIAVAE